MSAPYLQWLSLLPEVGPERARAIAERFPDFERLKAAYFEELVAIPGVDERLARKLLDLVRIRATEPPEAPSSALYLCPACGSFAAEGTATCPSCGAAFAGTEAPAEREDDGLSWLISGTDRTVPLCARCGAFLPSGRVCSICEARYDDEAFRRLPVWSAKSPSEDLVPCGKCGAFVDLNETACPICATEVPPRETRPAEPRVSRGVGRDFLSRWKRIAEGEPSPVAGPELPPKPAEVVPQPEVAPTEPAGPPPGPPKLEAPAAPTPPEPVPPVPEFRPRPRLEHAAGRDVELLQEVLSRYDALVRADPSLRAAWETRGDLLTRLGRLEDAEDSYRRAVEVASRFEPAPAPSRAGFTTAAPGASSGASGVARRDGRTNGKVNGQASGRINGLVNGRVNGRVNGLGPGTAAPSGATLGIGRTNGLINGDGFTNGRTGRGPLAAGVARRDRARTALWITLVAGLMLTVPVLATLLTPESAPLGIAIDGTFGDWVGVIAHSDSPSDESQNADVNLIEYKVAAGSESLAVYSRVEGALFRGAGNGADAILVLVDTDSDNRTGYALGRFGADEIAEVYGWDDQIRGSAVGRFSSADRNDWGGFRFTGSVKAAMTSREIELEFLIANPRGAEVLVVAAGGRQALDRADALVRPNAGSVVVDQVAIGPDVIASSAPVLQVDLTPNGGPVAVTSVNVSLQGSTPPSAVALSLYRDGGDDVFDAADTLLGNVSSSFRDIAFPIALQLVARTRLFVHAYLAAPPAQTTLGALLSGVAANATVSWGRENPGLSYVAAPPANVTVDGAFGDWAVVPRSSDAPQDVVNRSGSSLVQNDNVDLTSVGSTTDGVTASFFLEVAGRMLGGDDIPNLQARTAPSPPDADTDRDTVPDRIESNLSNPDLQWDFSNDNISDAAQSCDVDGDGAQDYGCAGVDVWLNTTIPSWYPAPYSGRMVSLYIGPIAPESLVPVDAVYAYIDADNNSASGLPMFLGPVGYGIDFAVSVTGRGGGIVSSGLYRYVSGSAVPFAYVGAATAATDASRIEVQTSAAAMSLRPDYRTLYYAADWHLDSDVALPTPPARVSRPTPQSPSGDFPVINEVVPHASPEWIELANPSAFAFNLAGWSIGLVRGNKVTPVYRFGPITLGPWGSASAYLAVNLPANSLPNGGGTLRLLNPVDVIVDQTTYPGNLQGFSWSRFKDPLTGKPMDSDNDAADFYISSLPTFAGANDRHRPQIAVAKTVIPAVAAPGEVLTYSIYYNNTDTGRANFAWVNDTLPSGVTFVGSSVPPTSVSGSTYGWTFQNVEPLSSNALTVSVQVNLVPDLTSLVNTVTLAYTDQLNRLLAGSQAWANATVQRPVIAVSKVASPSSALPGDIVTYTIYYNNTGSSTAYNVVVTDTLPENVTFLSSSIPPSSVSGRTYVFNIGTVTPGPHSFTITVQVTPNATGTLVNWAFLNYTTAAGYALEASSDSAIVAVPEFGTAAPLVLAAVLGIAVLAGRVRRSGRAPASGAKEKDVADSVPDDDGR